MVKIGIGVCVGVALTFWFFKSFIENPDGWD